MHPSGQTRSSHRPNHLLHTPDAFIRTSLPGLERGSAIVHVSPALGAGFTQYTVELESHGTLAAADHQRFLYVLEGSANLASGTSSNMLAPGAYAYLPPGSPHTLAATTDARIAVIEKPYERLPGTTAPTLLVGEESIVPSSPLLGDPDLQFRQLLPDHRAYDFAVNTMTYQPGAALSQVEIHIMEHGLLMLQGGGIYRLGDNWYSVTAGDFIWMAPYCPQWFAAVGRQPAKYLIYKDANRRPI